MISLGPGVFVYLARAIQAGRAIMTRESPNDKEFFVQNWVESVLTSAYTLEQRPRNAHPDYVVKQGTQAECLEVKSLENVPAGRRDPSTAPCRTDVDFNSCIPCGKVKVSNEVLRCYYVFVLYEKVEQDNPLTLKAVAMTLVDGNFLNRDIELSLGHRNTSESGFGSYGDAFIRTRKMYRFPNPLTYPAFRYRTVFVTEDVFPNAGDLGLKVKELVTKVGRDGREYRFTVYELD